MATVINNNGESDQRLELSNGRKWSDLLVICTVWAIELGSTTMARATEMWKGSVNNGRSRTMATVANNNGDKVEN